MDISLSELSEVKGIGKKTIQRIREYKLADEGYISKYDESLHLDRDSVNQGDCLKLMNGIPDKSIDMILADLPYGTTSCSWDSIIDLDKLWLQYERIIKDNGAIVLTASQPFASTLINSNKQLFRYELLWIKEQGTNHLQANKMPMKKHENVLVFYKKQPNYNPQFTKAKTEWYKKDTGKTFNEITSTQEKEYIKKSNGKKRFPTSVDLKFDRPKQNGEHPTQKPTELFEYLIKTYTNEGDLVLDNTAGSGTTGVACQNTNRDYILIEQEEKYINIIKDRLKGGDR